MVSIQPCVAEDLFSMQACNTANLPENYQMKYYFYHFLSWPQLLYIAESNMNETAGYVLAKMNDESEPHCHGHITSISVSRPHRKQGIAQQLLLAAHNAMQGCFNAEYSSLHVRVSNRAAHSLYLNIGYKKHELEKMYYSDREDALNLHCLFPYGEAQNAFRNEMKQRKAQEIQAQENSSHVVLPPNQESQHNVSHTSSEPKLNSQRRCAKSKKNKKKK